MTSHDRFRIVSWNVRYFSQAAGGLGSTRKSRHGIAAALADLDPAPDIICLQEIELRSLRSRIGRPPERAVASQLEAFMESLGERCHRLGKSSPWEALYFPAHRYGILDAALYTTGLAILVHRERVSVEGHNAASPQPITHFIHVGIQGAKQGRIVAHVALTTPTGRRFHVFNTHVSLPTPFARQFWREKLRMGHGPNQVAEVGKLSDFVRSRAGEEPYILCGDFNAAPASPVYRTLIDDLGCTGAQAELGQIDPRNPGGFPTAGVLALRMHLDHLFSGGAVRWIDLDGTFPFGTGPFRGLSDHSPLIGRFELLPGRPDAVI
jgi:endonuclease/exonuclease/phosphatase family metal-dependent hydrolase